MLHSQHFYNTLILSDRLLLDITGKLRKKKIQWQVQIKTSKN